MGLLGRLAVLGALLTLELLAVLAWLWNANLPQSGLFRVFADWLAREWTWGGTLLRSGIAFWAFFATFGLISARGVFQRLSRRLTQVPLSWRFAAGHGGAVVAFGVLLHLLLGGIGPAWLANLLAVACLGTAGTAGVLAVCVFVPARLGLQCLRDARGVCAVAAVAGLTAGWLEKFRSFLWEPLIALTLGIVRTLLHPLVPDLAVNLTTGLVSSHRFAVAITPECAGLQGAGLMLVFAVAWLWGFRRECRFPQALLLVPASIAVVWVLNAVRLAVLFLIGDAGAPGVAMGGFHSQAGWISLCGVALGFSLVLDRAPGLTKVPLTARRGVMENPTAWYVVPFLAILATGMITRAASSGFESLYPLRFLVAALVLWHYRPRYAPLDWRIGWAAPLAGGIAFAMWLALDLIPANRSVNSIGAGLAALTPPLRVGWVAFRVLAATVTVPLAEELAFRGFLLRRLVSAEFEKASFHRLTLLALIGSSLAFGLMHGNRWLAGTLAGLLYAFALRHRGRIGDAVAAHAITNLLLAAWVLLTGNWQLW